MFPVWKKQIPARLDQEQPKLLKIKPVSGWMLNKTLQNVSDSVVL